MLCSFQFGSNVMATHIHVLEQNLLRYALQQYEQCGAYEQMFQLFPLAPETPALTDTELKRMRNRTYLYEMGRVRLHRRWLYAYLVVQVALIVLVFPLLFIAAENGTLQRLFEAGAQLNLPHEATRSFTYTEGLYWSLITAASIGYGGITPHSSIGKGLAAALGLMAVITVGVIAGLILNWISPGASTDASNSLAAGIANARSRSTETASGARAPATARRLRASLLLVYRQCAVCYSDFGRDMLRSCPRNDIVRLGRTRAKPIILSGSMIPCTNLVADWCARRSRSRKRRPTVSVPSGITAKTISHDDAPNSVSLLVYDYLLRSLLI
jgi:hypothetical protein